MPVGRRGMLSRKVASITGRVKWFDATRGFGFLVSDDLRRRHPGPFQRAQGAWPPLRCPKGATIECIAAHQDRGLQAQKILSIDLSTALPLPPAPVHSSGERADRKALADAAGEYEPVEVKWFNRVKGYGFLNRRARRGGRGHLRPHGDGAPVARSSTFSRASSWKRGSREGARA